RRPARLVPGGRPCRRSKKRRCLESLQSTSFTGARDGIQSRFDIKIHGILRRRGHRAISRLAANSTIAHALMNGEAAALNEVASGILKPLRCNFVERPWGGMRIRDYKRVCPLPDQPSVTGAGLGEAFEIAAYD